MNISTLICHRDMPTGLACLGAFVRCVAHAPLIVHDDGSLTDEDAERLAAVLPVAVVLRRRDADAHMRERLARHPACARARGTNVLMLKLFDVALMSSDADIRYCDTDVLFFRVPERLFQRTAELPPAVFMQDRSHAYALRPWHLLGARALRVPGRLNSGLFMFAREAFDLDFLEWLLGREDLQEIFARIPVWAEQTCWAALAFRAGCGLWDPTFMAVVDDAWRLDKRSVAAHFVSSSRHRLADALRQADALAKDQAGPMAVPVLGSRECTAFELARTQLARRLRRTCGF